MVFAALVADSVHEANLIADAHPITPSVAAGKRVWEKHACFDCHTLMGEGARFAPELKTVWQRYEGDKDPQAAREALKAWIQSQPTRVEGRHQMPQFNLTDEELNEVIDFLEWNSTIPTQNWPPHISG